jgi:hypothetical protein
LTEKLMLGLIVFEVSHPIRPVPAHMRSLVYGVDAAIPLELPQLLEPDFSDGVIQKSAVYVPVVPVDAKGIHSGNVTYVTVI